MQKRYDKKVEFNIKIKNNNFRQQQNWNFQKQNFRCKRINLSIISSVECLIQDFIPELSI